MGLEPVNEPPVIQPPAVEAAALTPKPADVLPGSEIAEDEEEEGKGKKK